MSAGPQEARAAGARDRQRAPYRSFRDRVRASFRRRDELYCTPKTCHSRHSCFRGEGRREAHRVFETLGVQVDTEELKRGALRLQPSCVKSLYQEAHL